MSFLASAAGLAAGLASLLAGGVWASPSVNPAKPVRNVSATSMASIRFM